MPSDYSLYSALFQSVAAHKAALVYGRITADPAPSIQEASGLTDQEMKALNAIAADCQGRLDSITLEAGGVVRTRRLGTPPRTSIFSILPSLS